MKRLSALLVLGALSALAADPNPSVHYVEGCLFDVAERFLCARPGDVPLTLYIWGHTYEMDADCGMNWQDFDRLCALLGGREEIFYGTNAEVLLGK